MTGDSWEPPGGKGDTEIAPTRRTWSGMRIREFIGSRRGEVVLPRPSRRTVGGAASPKVDARSLATRPNIGTPDANGPSEIRNQTRSVAREGSIYDEGSPIIFECTHRMHLKSRPLRFSVVSCGNRN